jgi:hypothetical protein
MPGEKKTAARTHGSHWPEHLRRNYRKLAIPAVVAAVMADRRQPEKPKNEARGSRAKAGAKR